MRFKPGQVIKCLEEAVTWQRVRIFENHCLILAATEDSTIYEVGQEYSGYGTHHQWPDYWVLDESYKVTEMLKLYGQE